MFFKNLLRRMFREAALPRRNGLRFRPAVESIEERITPASVTIAALGDITEGGSAASFRFTRSDNTDTFSVGITTTGTASGLDYSYMPMVTFTAGGSLTADLSITPTNDSNIEGTETITVTIVPNPPYYSSNGSATMNLFDDDTPQVTVAKIADAAENGSAGTFRITRTGPTTSSLGVTFTTGGTATSGTDYTSIGTGATIASGNSYVDVTVTALADNVVESGGETVTIDITDGGSNYTANGASASLTIADDPPVISISAANAAENASGAFTFTRTGGKIADALTVNYTRTGGTATSGTDFTALSGSVVIGAGKSSADVTLAALADNLVEGDETVEVTISSGGTDYTIGTATATATITDDPPVVSVSRLNDGTEGGSNGAFRVSRTGGDISQTLVVTYTVAGTANPSSNTDYTALTGTVTIAASASYADITVTVTNDGSVESAETVILTQDTDTDWVNGSPTATLFIWDNDGTYIEWEGDENDSWMDPDNWAGGVVPGYSDTAVFSGTPTYDPILSGPLSPVVVGGIEVAASFAGTITIAFPISAGSLNMAGGTIDQPSSAYGSDITITGAASWIGGVLNSTANAASVIFDGATSLIDGIDLETGSEFQFINATAEIAPTVQAPATITFNNGVGVYVNGGSYVIIGSTGTTNMNNDVVVNGGTVSIQGTASLNSLHVHSGGTAFIGSGNKTVSFNGNVAGWGTTSVLVLGGKLNIQNGTTLDGGTKQIHVSGWDGSPAFTGELNTYASNHKSQTTASIKASKLLIGTSGGNVTVTIANDSLAAGGHVYSELDVQCNVDWERGTFVPTIGAPGVRDRWTSTGVVKVKGSTTSIIPISGTGMTANQDYSIIESKNKFAEFANNNGALPGLSGWSYAANTGFNQVTWQIRC